MVLADSRYSRPSGRTADVEENDYVNLSRNQTTIGQHLRRLVEADVVEEVVLPEERRRSDLLYKLYGISENGQQFLENHKLLLP